MAGKQAKRLTPRQIKTALAYLATTRHPARNTAIFLLSVRAGLRAKEIAELSWAMITGPEGEELDRITLTDHASKGQSGRTIYMAKDLRHSLTALTPVPDSRDRAVIQSERGAGMSAATITNWFHRLYQDLGFSGCSSHSGRRTFGTQAARNITQAGGSLKDVQELMGHRSLQTTQQYIDSSEDAKRRVVDLA